MVIPGYRDGPHSPLVDGAPLMRHVLFWPAFLYAVGGAACAPDAFDADLADLDVVLDELSDPTRWPVFTLAMNGDARLHIVMRNDPDDAGVDYVLAPGGGAGALRLAALEGHFIGPAVSWPEVVSAFDAADGHAGVDRFLLLLPALGDASTPAAAHRMTTLVVTTAGAVRDQPTLAAQLLDSRRYWTPSPWTALDGVPVCLGSHSARRPDGPLSATALELVAAAFAPRGRAATTARREPGP